MTTLEVKLDLPDRLAREAQAAGLLTPKALRQMLKDAILRCAGAAGWRRTRQCLWRQATVDEGDPGRGQLGPP